MDVLITVQHLTDILYTKRIKHVFKNVGAGNLFKFTESRFLNISITVRTVEVTSDKPHKSLPHAHMRIFSLNGTEYLTDRNLHHTTSSGRDLRRSFSISSNSALFSILGTTYGGDGRTTFALPDLRGRAPVHHGTGPGLKNVRLGQKGGQEVTTLKKVDAAAPSTSSTKVPVAPGGQECEVRSPYLGVSYIICVQGMYPSRS